MVRFKIVTPSSGPLCICFPRKCYVLKLSKTQVAHFLSMFQWQMVRLKIVEALKLHHFFQVSLANGTP